MKHERIVIGSTAAKHWFPDFKREPNDLDVITRDPAPISQKLQEVHYGPSSDWILENNQDDIYLDADLCYTIKAAHCKFSRVFWEKTMQDILFFQSKELKINEELFKLALKDFIQLHGRQWVSLKDKTNVTFFEDAVKRVYVHDTIHHAVAYGEQPIYETILSKENEVDCSKEKFLGLPYEKQIDLVVEEIVVTSLERFMIPNEFRFSSLRGYMLSLKKMLTSMSSTGYFFRFILDNYGVLSARRNDNYVERFKANMHKLILMNDSKELC